MRRREFIAGLGGAIGWPLAARGQQSNRVRRVGVLVGFSDTDDLGQDFVRELRKSLTDCNVDCLSTSNEDCPNCFYERI